MDTYSTYTLLAAAAFAAGVLNAIAGGGSFLTFPALVFTGVPPIVANATSALAVSPGYLGSTLGFREELRALPARRLKLEMLISAVGGVAGALLLLVTPSHLFTGIVPWLLLFATALFAAGVIPGLMAVVFYSVVVAIIARVKPEWMPRGERHGWAERFASLKQQALDTFQI